MRKTRLRLLLENFLFYGGMRMLTPLIPLIMLPIISRLLSATSYGVVDMFGVTIYFGAQLVGLGIWDAMFREYFEKNDELYKKKVISTALGITIISGILFSFSVLPFSKYFVEVLYSSQQYRNLIFLSILGINIQAIKAVLEAPTIMENNKKIFFWTNLSTPIMTYTLIISLIKIGYTYEALIYSSVVVNLIFLFIFLKLNWKKFSYKYFDLKMTKGLFKIGISMLPMALIYWVLNSSDRIMITKLLNLEELGVYSIGAKLASVSHVVTAAVSGGWSHFAFSTMKDEDQVELNSKIFEYLSIISILIFICSLPFIKPVFNLLFIGQYRRGGEVFPYLLLSPLILLMNQIISTQTMIVKKPYLSTFSMLIGGIVNIILNLILIKKFGIKGAAISTLLSYMISLGISLTINVKNGLNKLTKRIIYIFIIFSLDIILVFYNLKTFYYPLSGIIILAIIILYYKDFKNVFKK